MKITVLLVLLLSSSLAAQTWRSGDTHVHQQTCTEPELSLSEVGVQKEKASLDFVALQLWAKWNQLPEYLALAPLVDGTEPLPGLRYGVEVSGFPASQFGHLQILDAQTGFFPTGALWSGPIFDFYRPSGALLGYAHVTWTESYAPALFFGGLGAPYMAPIDAANRACDFIESADIDKLGVGPGGQPTSWRGLYYKLENAGLRIGLAAGSDDTCMDSTGIGDPRTWAVADSYDGWCDEIRAGRGSLGDGMGTRIEMTLDATGITATLHDPTQDGTFAILVNGANYVSTTYHASLGDKTLAVPFLPFSSWIVARAPGAHTAASYVIFNDEPIVVEADALYWRDYCNAFEAALPVFGVAPAQAEMVTAIHQARDIYAALARRAGPNPPWAVEYGASTRDCYGPISAGGGEEPVTLDCLAAPTDAHGYLMVGLAQASVTVAGITLLVSPSAPYVLLPVVASHGGYAQVTLPFKSGKVVYAQWIWPADCGGLLCASDGLAVTAP